MIPASRPHGALDNGRGTLADGALDGRLIVAGDAHPHGDHGIHAGQVHLPAALPLDHVAVMPQVGVDDKASALTHSRRSALSKRTSG